MDAKTVPSSRTDPGQIAIPLTPEQSILLLADKITALADNKTRRQNLRTVRKLATLFLLIILTILQIYGLSR